MFIILYIDIHYLLEVRPIRIYNPLYSRYYCFMEETFKVKRIDYTLFLRTLSHDFTNKLMFVPISDKEVT